MRGIHRWPVNSPHKWPVTRSIWWRHHVQAARYCKSFDNQKLMRLIKQDVFLIGNNCQWKNAITNTYIVSKSLSMKNMVLPIFRRLFCIKSPWDMLSYTTVTGYMSDAWTAWWRHLMETFSALLAICAGNSPVTGEFPPQRPVTRSFDVFFDLRLNKRLRKQ